MNGLQETQNRYRLLLIRTDIFTIILGFVISTGIFELIGKVNFEGRRTDIFLICLFPFIWVFSLAVRSSWSLSKILKPRELIYSTIESGILSTLLFSWICFNLKDPFPRSFVYGSLIFINFLLSLNRTLIYQIFTKKAFASKYKQVLFFGKNSEIENCKEKLESLKIKIDSFIPIEYTNLKEDEIIQKVYEYSKNNKANILYLGKSVLKTSSLLTRLSHVHINGYARIYIESEIGAILPRIQNTSLIDVLELKEPRISDSGLAIKRMIDVILSFLGIVVLSPLFLWAYILIKITSDGPALYISKRLGLRNEEFSFPKFRTMYVGADSDREQALGQDLDEIKKNYKSDPRITKLGKFLRRWSIDEIPQLWSVLKGDMSIVGPRPILKSELSLIDENQFYRFAAKPGLTGLWQIEGRKEVRWDDRIQMEINYIENWSILGDLHLIIRTLVAILNGRGAY